MAAAAQAAAHPADYAADYAEARLQPLERATALLANELEAATIRSEQEPISRERLHPCPPRSNCVPRPSPRLSAPPQLSSPGAIGARGRKIGARACQSRARKSRGYSSSSSG